MCNSCTGAGGCREAEFCVVTSVVATSGTSRWWVRADHSTVEAGDARVEEHDRHTRGHTGAVGAPEFAQVLARHRAAASLTQEQLADRAGLSVRGLRYLERGERVPYPDTVSRLAEALRLSAEERRDLVTSATARGQSGREPMPVLG